MHYSPVPYESISWNPKYNSDYAIIHPSKGVYVGYDADKGAQFMPLEQIKEQGLSVPTFSYIHDAQERSGLTLSEMSEAGFKLLSRDKRLGSAADGKDHWFRASAEDVEKAPVSEDNMMIRMRGARSLHRMALTRTVQKFQNEVANCKAGECVGPRILKVSDLTVKPAQKPKTAPQNRL